MGKMLMATAAAVAVLAGGSTALAKTEGVEITHTGFNDQTLTIQSGDSVTWKNMDTTLHQVTVDKTSCNLSLEPGQSSACTFTTPGTFTYKDPTMSANGFAGTLTVGQNTRSVSIASTRSVGILGDATTLSGTVSSKQAGESVTIVAHPAGGQPLQTTQVTTTTGGAWSLQVQPVINTSYQASFDGAASASLQVNVRPRITLEKVGRSRYLAVVVGSRSLAGKTVELTRRIGGSWVTIGQQQLQNIARTNTTVVAVFSASVPSGTKLRVFMPATQTGPDFLDGHSNFVVN